MIKTIHTDGRITFEGTILEIRGLATDPRILYPSQKKKKCGVQKGSSWTHWSAQEDEFLLELAAGPKKLTHAQQASRLNAVNSSKTQRTARAVEMRVRMLTKKKQK